MAIFLILMVLVAGVFGFHFWSKRQTRAHLLATALPDFHRAIVEQQVPLVRKLPADLQDKLEGKINLFLEQVEFIGCNDLEVTDDLMGR
jgi:Mlc titration factor MtfA (ptsG expression regulator)